jgi:putative selenate reductase molybdopterin-binding subunit
MPEGRTIGQGERRRDSVKLATGRGTFTDDIAVRGALHGWVLTSPHPHAHIERIDADLARSMPGVAAVLTHLDVPAPVHEATPLLSPHLRFVGDRVALVAAEDLELAQRAAQAIDVHYEPLPPVFDLPANPESATPYAEVNADVGDVEAALSQAEFHLVRTYQLPRVAQTAIEPQVVLAWLDEDERLVVRTSSHVPFHVRHVLARRLGLPVRRIRVLSPRDGGAFGGRIGVEVEDLCAALVLKTGRPVRLARTREQELIGARSGHAQTITIRSGVAHGELVALDVTVLENAGAAEDDWATIALRAAGGVAGLYRCPNMRFRGRAYATNLPPAGSVRGDGLAQATFALESHVDEIAARLGDDPVAFRARHHVREGDPAPLASALAGGPPGRLMLVHSCGLEEALRAGARAIGWPASREPPALGDRPQRRGLGVALAVQAPGPLGAEMTSATIDMLEDGSFHLFVGTADMGAGTETVLCQIAAEVLEAPLDSVVAHSADTDVVPFASGPTRSSALYVSGLAVRDAALQVRARLIERAAVLLKVPRDEVTLNGAYAHSRHHRLGYDEIGRAALTGEGPTPVTGTASRAVEEAAPPSFAAVFAEVEVDSETGGVRVLKLVEAVDCGQVLNPQIAEARITGGALQGLGYALTESIRFDALGQSLARSLRDYRIPTAIDAPQIHVHFVATHEPTGPFGAKSIAEIPIPGVAPAIANAVAHAVGARVVDLPLTPERVLAAILASQTPH